MTEKDREVTITVGDRNYTIRTFLDETVLNRILENVEDAVMGCTGDQEKRLLAACLDLSYRLDSINSQLKTLQKHPERDDIS